MNDMKKKIQAAKAVIKNKKCFMCNDIATKKQYCKKHYGMYLYAKSQQCWSVSDE